MTVFLAGHETTAMNLTWTYSLLRDNPETTEALRRELAEVCGDRPVAFSDLRQMPLMDRVALCVAAYGSSRFEIADSRRLRLF